MVSGGSIGTLALQNYLAHEGSLLNDEPCAF
jgi:hypothetical protein